MKFGVQGSCLRVCLSVVRTDCRSPPLKLRSRPPFQNYKQPIGGVTDGISETSSRGIDRNNRAFRPATAV